MSGKPVLSIALVVTCIVCLSNQSFGQGAGGALGIFESQSDVGSVTPPGKMTYDAASRVYTIESAGANLWAAEDGFHFAWKKMSGEVSLTADLSFPLSPAGASPHRKALLMFRQTLDPDSMYADAAIHGNGETALQYRHSKGDTTQDIAFNSGAPKTLRLEKRGDTITLFISQTGEPLHQAGASIKLHFDEPFYAGIGVCAHNKDAVERADLRQRRVEAARAAQRRSKTFAVQHAPNHRDRQQRAHGHGGADRTQPHRGAQLDPRR